MTTSLAATDRSPAVSHLSTENAPSVEARLHQLAGTVEALELMAKGLMAERADGTYHIGGALIALASSLSQEVRAIAAALHGKTDERVPMNIVAPTRYSREAGRE